MISDKNKRILGNNLKGEMSKISIISINFDLLSDDNYYII
jgi:hypothetical protein